MEEPRLKRAKPESVCCVFPVSPLSRPTPALTHCLFPPPHLPGQRSTIGELLQSIPHPLAYSRVWLMGSTGKICKGGVGICSFNSLPAGVLTVSLLKPTIPVRQPPPSNGQPLWVSPLLPLFAYSGLGVVSDPIACP